MKSISTGGLNRSDQPVINCISDDEDDSYSNIYNVLKPNYGKRRILYQACIKEKACERSSKCRKHTSKTSLQVVFLI